MIRGYLKTKARSVGMGIFSGIFGDLFSKKGSRKKNAAGGLSVPVIDSATVTVVQKARCLSPACLAAAAKKYLIILRICSVPKGRFKPYG